MSMRIFIFENRKIKLHQTCFVIYNLNMLITDKIFGLMTFFRIATSHSGLFSCLRRK